MWGGLAAAGAWMVGERGARADATVKLIVPDDHNRQFLAAWLALGSGLADSTELVIPPHRRLAVEHFSNAKAPLAILPAPLYLSAIADGVPLVLVANLLARDAVNVVVGRRLLGGDMPSPKAPLAERLGWLKGKRIGVARGPMKRWRQLLAGAGLPDDHAAVVSLPGKRQNDALEAEEVDALFVHAPFLERALVDQGARLLVDVSGGDVPGLTGLTVHALVGDPTWMKAEPAALAVVLRQLVGAVHRARAFPDQVGGQLASWFPDEPFERLRVIGKLYARALPETLTPSVASVMRTYALFPNLFRTTLSAAQVEAVVDVTTVPRVEEALRAELLPESDPAKRLLAPAAVVAAGGIAGYLAQRGRQRRGRL